MTPAQDRGRYRVNSPAGAGALAQLRATEAVEKIRSGALSARDYSLALLERVRQTEDQVQAWTCLDPDFLLAQADAADAAQRAGSALGPLHGLPIGVKDIIDTSELPTQNGTVLHEGRQPLRDASVVSRFRAAGGLLMGKTVTTELATYAPGKTRNPHNPAYTPGGSSSGSAAAVAAGMAPLAIGSQTNGSIIRPASFCGVVGYKPSAGWISRAGVLVQSPALDQLGVYGRSVADVALLAQCLAGHDPQDPATRASATPPLLATAGSQPPSPPVLAFVRTPMWDHVTPDAQSAFLELAQFLGSRVVELELPQATNGFLDLHRLVMEADIAGSFEPEYERGRDRLSASLRGQIERGRQVSAVDYRRALDRRAAIRAAMDSLYDRFDAILTPAALGTAPMGLDATGDPVMCTLWTFTGQPAISLPLLRGANGLPIGAQLVGRRYDDARLLRTAQWLARTAPHG
jgi:Asp-tRNA(Asn)/Glu-tRNA(Gln) amidotransferase A subunit family amidase